MNSLFSKSFAFMAIAVGGSPLLAQSAASASLPAVVGGSVSVSAVNAPRVQAATQADVPLVRPGEVEAAPWVDNLGGPANTGKLILATDIPGTAMRPEEKIGFQYSEYVYVVPPAAGTAAVGQTFLAFTRAEVVGGEGQVMVPTGVLRIQQAGAAGEAAVAKVIKQFAPIRMHDLLIPAAAPSTARTGTLTPISGGATGQVTWVGESRVLPLMHTYLIVDVGAAAGVRSGDIFTLLRPRMQHGDGTWLPEKEIARARVVRVTERGSTIIIIDQTEPAVRVGTAVRLTARAP